MTSGPNIPNAQRRRRQVTVTLSPEELAALDRVAVRRRTTRSGAAGQLAVESDEANKVEED